MSLPFDYETLSIAADYLGDQKLTRDFLVVEKNKAAITVVVGDMADTHTGTLHRDPETAKALGLPDDTPLNAGLIAKCDLSRELHQLDTKTDVVARANQILKATHERLGLLGSGQPPESVDPAERCMGLIASVIVGPEQTSLTTMGDISVWVNGTPVWQVTGMPLSRVVGNFVTALADPWQWEHAIKHFAQLIDLHGTEGIYDQLRLALQEQQKADQPFSRQSAYRAVSATIMPWYVRRLQNNFEHPLGYGQIDGTATPRTFIRHRIILTKDVRTLVIATDGFAPLSAQHPVFGLTDLKAADSLYGDRTAVQLRRT
jgi:hypothetical protein